MGKIISMINLKGGVGKTVLTINIAKMLVQKFNKKVLIIDLDAQMNATMQLIATNEWEYINSKGETLFELFNSAINARGYLDINSIIKRNVQEVDGLDLIPSSIQMINIESQINTYGMSWYTNYFNILRSYLESMGVREQYDYVLIDCPPTLGMITLNGIYTSDAYLIPVLPHEFSIMSAQMLIRQIEDFKIRTNYWDIQLGGIIINRVNYRREKDNRIIRELEWGELGKYVMHPFVPEKASYNLLNGFDEYRSRENTIDKQVFYDLAVSIMNKAIEW